MNVRAAVDSTTSIVGGRVLVTVELDDASGWTVNPPSPGTELGTFLVRSVVPRPASGASTASFGREASMASTEAAPSEFTMTLIPTKPGELEIPPIQLEARTPNGVDTTLASNPVRVLVRSNLTGEEVAPGDSATAAAQPADYKPALEAPRDWAPVWIALAALVVATALGLLIARRLRRLRRRPVAAPAAAAVQRQRTRPAWEIALEELDRIAKEDHVGRGRIGVQYVEVTEALRRYLENRYGVPALESTTDELAPRLEQAPLDADAKASVVTLLREADLVKFAKTRPDPVVARALEHRVRAIVKETTPRALEVSAS